MPKSYSKFSNLPKMLFSKYQLNQTKNKNECYKTNLYIKLGWVRLVKKYI